MNQAPQNMDHLNETMLYKAPGPHEIHGGHFDYVIVPEADIEEAKAQGWHLTTQDARAAHDQQKADEHQRIMQKMEQETAITAPPPPLPVPAAALDPAYSIDGMTLHPLEHIPQSIVMPAIVPAPAPVSIEQSTQLTQQEETAPVTYDEMKTKAKQLGLEFQGNISKAALLAMINAKLAEQV